MAIRLDSRIAWLDAPTWPALAAAWLAGVGGAFLSIAAGKKILPEYLAPFALLSIFLSLSFGVVAWRLWYRDEIDVFSLKGWPAALVIFGGLLLSEIINASAHLRGDVLHPRTLIALFYCVVLVGLQEELWWRGIWFSMFKGRPVMCILAGSLLFGASHYQLHGFRSVAMAFFVGLVFSAARHRGVSIGALSLAHGLNDWIAQGHVVRWQWHASRSRIDLILYGICLLLTAWLLFRWRTEPRFRA
ncbi:MAG TPA: CPBP family intramembrane metalloprotease [Elusimicrobiales bacterium]|nr:CPBP family intramembrane metalloprotease [Elusimicrobiales bacterium]